MKNQGCQLITDPARVLNYEPKKLFCGSRNKSERTTVLSECRLFRETENFRNSVPSYSAEQKYGGISFRIIPAFCFAKLRILIKDAN
jgi:hypothetical protein